MFNLEVSNGRCWGNKGFRGKVKCWENRRKTRALPARSPRGRALQSCTAPTGAASSRSTAWARSTCSWFVTSANQGTEFFLWFHFKQFTSWCFLCSSRKILNYARKNFDPWLYLLNYKYSEISMWIKYFWWKCIIWIETHGKYKMHTRILKT